MSGGLRFTVLGSGTAKPDPARGPTGFLLQAHGASVLIDGGSGTLHRLARVGVDAVELDAGVYSHRHVDHSGDFVPLLFAMCVPPKRTSTGAAKAVVLTPLAARTAAGSEGHTHVRGAPPAPGTHASPASDVFTSTVGAAGAAVAAATARRARAARARLSMVFMILLRSSAATGAMTE